MSNCELVALIAVVACAIIMPVMGVAFFVTFVSFNRRLEELWAMIEGRVE